PRRLRRSLGAVARRRQLLGGIPAAGFRRWTAEEDALVGTMLDRQLAARLGRSLHAVRLRRQKTLGLPPCNPEWKVWSKPHKALLGKLPDTEVAARTGHPLGSVKAKRQELGIPLANPKLRYFTPAEDKLLGQDT